jgi:hypothetical protein
MHQNYATPTTPNNNCYVGTKEAHRKPKNLEPCINAAARSSYGKDTAQPEADDTRIDLQLLTQQPQVTVHLHLDTPIHCPAQHAQAGIIQNTHLLQFRQQRQPGCITQNARHKHHSKQQQAILLHLPNSPAG